MSYLPIPYGGYAKAINNQNIIVGATGNSSSTGGYSHAHLYDYDNGILKDLGTLNSGTGLTSSATNSRGKSAPGRGSQCRTQRRQATAEGAIQRRRFL